jgi:hypothetical protein
MSVSGLRSSSTFESLFRDSVKDKALDQKEYQALKQEFTTLNPGADFDLFLKERFSNKMDISMLKGLASKHDATPLELSFPIAEEKLRVFGSADFNLQLTDRNGFATEGRDDLQGTVSGSMSLGGVVSLDIPIIGNTKLDLNDLRSYGLDMDSQGRLSLNSNSPLGFIEFLASKTVDSRKVIQDTLREMGIESTIREENGRVYFDPQNIELTGAQLKAMGIQTPISADAKVSIDLTKNTQLTMENGQLKINFDQAQLIGSSNENGPTVSDADTAKAESAEIAVKGQAAYSESIDAQGQSVTQLQGQELEAKIKVDVKTLQAIQAQLLAEDPQTGPIHASLKAAGLSSETIEKLKTGSQEMLDRLLRDPESKIDIALKAQQASLSTHQSLITPDSLTRLQDRLKAEDPQTGKIHAMMRESGFSEDFISRLRQDSVENLEQLVKLPTDANPALVANLRNLENLFQSYDYSQIVSTDLEVKGLSASVTSSDGEGKETGKISLSAETLTASIEDRRKTLDATGIKGEARGALTLTQDDVTLIEAKLKDYKAMVYQKLQELGLTGEQFNQIVQMLSKDNLQAMLASATPEKITDLASQLGLSENQTRKLVDFFNTDALKQSVDDIFRLTQALGENTRVEGDVSFSLASLGWSQADQNSVAHLKGLSATVIASGTSPSGSQVKGAITVDSEKLDIHSTPDSQGNPNTSTIEAGKTTVTTQVSGQGYTNEGKPLPPEELKQLLAKNEISAFYQGSLGQARDLEKQTGVPAAAIIAAVRAKYENSTPSQKQKLDISQALEQQAQELAAKFPKAVEAFRKSGDVQDFLKLAKNLPAPPTPKLLAVAHDRYNTQGGAHITTSGAAVTEDGKVTINPGEIDLGQNTEINGKAASTSTISGTFGELSLAERPELLKAVQATLQDQFPKFKLEQRPMQEYLKKLGMNYDQIKALRQATPEQLSAMLNDPAQKALLAPLLNTLKAASFTVSGSSEANGQKTQASISAQDVQIDGRGTLSMASLTADIVNGELTFTGALGRSETNADFTHLGDLKVVAKGPGLDVKISSPDLSILDSGQASGTVDASGEVSSKVKGSDLNAKGTIQVTLNQGEVTASRISGGRLLADIDVKTLQEMLKSDPNARAILDALAKQGISISSGQKVRVILDEAQVKNLNGKGSYSGNLVLPQLRTSFGPMSLKLNVKGTTSKTTGSQDIWGNVSFKPKPADLAAMLNRQIRDNLGVDSKDTSVQAGNNKAIIDFRDTFTSAQMSVSADGQNIYLNIDQAKLLSLFDINDAAANKIRGMLSDKGIHIRQENGKLVIPVAALNVLLQNELPAGMSIEGLGYRNGVLSGAFRYKQ